MTACPCDFCSGRKRWADNWCPRCARVQMAPPKLSDEYDVCDECEVDMATNRDPSKL